MNIIFLMGSNMPLSPQQIADQANALYPVAAKPFTAIDFSGDNSRISGPGHCDCGGDGEFELLPMSNPDVREGQKRYMICRKCGAYSHL